MSRSCCLDPTSLHTAGDPSYPLPSPALVEALMATLYKGEAYFLSVGAPNSLYAPCFLKSTLLVCLILVSYMSSFPATCPFSFL